MDSILTALEANVEKLYKEKKFHEVEEMFSTFLKESQTEPASIRARALNNRGHAKYMQVEFESALKDYNDALQLEPKLIVAKYNRGTILYRMGKFEQALEDLKTTAENESDNAEYQEAFEKCQKELK